MKKIIYLFTISALFLSACQNTNILSDSEAILENLESSCVKSGGNFVDNNCICPEDYLLENDLCMDAMGLPGGKMGEDTKETQNELMRESLAKTGNALTCINSGGTFSNGECTCPNKTYSINGEEIPLYNLEAGQCIDPMGVPAGKAGEEVKNDHALNMKKNQCENSGGTFANETCDCSKVSESSNYDESTGYCMTPFGIPGGELGEAIKKNHPLNQ